MDDYSLIDPLVNDGVQDSVAYTVITDKLDYAPGETATITASGFKVGSTIEFAIAETTPGDDGELDSDQTSPSFQPFSVTDGGKGDLDGVANGQVVTTWFVPTDNNGTGSGIPDALNATLNLTATGSNGQVATTTFTDSQEDYKHWANLPPLSATNWQNGALQQSNSQYYEGGVVPHYFTTKLDEGTTYSFWIAYDYYINGDDDGGFKRLNTRLVGL